MFSPDKFRMIRLALAALAGLLAVASATAHGANQSRVFQQGRDGYSGVHDTWISTSDWDTPSQDTVNYGRNQDLVLTRDGRENPLLRFDLSAIPANSAVVSATLWLYNTTPSSYSGTRNFPRRVNLFRVLRDWDEGNQVASPVDAPGKHGATGYQRLRLLPRRRDRCSLGRARHGPRIGLRDPAGEPRGCGEPGLVFLECDRPGAGPGAR